MIICKKSCIYVVLFLAIILGWGTVCGLTSPSFPEETYKLILEFVGEGVENENNNLAEETLQSISKGVERLLSDLLPSYEPISVVATNLQDTPDGAFDFDKTARDLLKSRAKISLVIMVKPSVSDALDITEEIDLNARTAIEKNKSTLIGVIVRSADGKLDGLGHSLNLVDERESPLVKKGAVKRTKGGKTMNDDVTFTPSINPSSIDYPYSYTPSTKPTLRQTDDYNNKNVFTGFDSCPCIDPFSRYNAAIEILECHQDEDCSVLDYKFYFKKEYTYVMDVESFINQASGDVFCDAWYNRLGITDVLGIDCKKHPDKTNSENIASKLCNYRLCFVDADNCNLPHESFLTVEGIHVSTEACGYINWSSDQESMAKQMLKDMTLNIAYTEDDVNGYTLYTTDDGNRAGTLVDFFQELSVKWDFKLNERQISDVSLNRKPSSIKKACAHDVELGVLDICIGGFLKTKELMVEGHMSTNFKEESFHLVVPQVTVKDEDFMTLIKMPIAVLTGGAWLAVIIVGVYASLVMCYITHTRLNDAASGHRTRSNVAGRLKRISNAVLFDGILSLTSGSAVHDHTPFADQLYVSQKFIVIGFAIFGLIFLSIYTANLAASLVIRNSGQLIYLSLNDIVDKNAKICLSSEVSDTFIRFNNDTFKGFERHLLVTPEDGNIESLRLASKDETSYILFDPVIFKYMNGECNAMLMKKSNYEYYIEQGYLCPSEVAILPNTEFTIGLSVPVAQKQLTTGALSNRGGFTRLIDYIMLDSINRYQELEQFHKEERAQLFQRKGCSMNTYVESFTSIDETVDNITVNRNLEGGKAKGKAKAKAGSSSAGATTSSTIVTDQADPGFTPMNYKEMTLPLLTTMACTTVGFFIFVYDRYFWHRNKTKRSCGVLRREDEGIDSDLELRRDLLAASPTELLKQLDTDTTPLSDLSVAMDALPNTMPLVELLFKQKSSDSGKDLIQLVKSLRNHEIYDILKKSLQAEANGGWSDDGALLEQAVNDSEDPRSRMIELVLSDHVCRENLTKLLQHSSSALAYNAVA